MRAFPRPSPSAIGLVLAVLADEGGEVAEGAVLLHENKPGNIEREVHHEFGDPAAGMLPGAAPSG